MNLSNEQAQAITGDASQWGLPLRVAAARWDIQTEDRLAHWLAQCAHESAGFTRTLESLDYSARRLLELFPRRFDDDDAHAFEHQQERIAERLYGGRMGNGPEGSGDGWTYRGRGPIQITGRENYAACGPAVGANLIESPSVLEFPVFGADAAGWYWATHGCNELADAGDIVAITKAINGGTIGLADRMAWLSKVRTILS